MSVQQDPRMKNPEFREAVTRRDAERHRAASESFYPVTDAIRRWLDVKVDPSRLEVGEIAELRELVAKVTHVDDPGIGRPALRVRPWNIDALDRKETKRFEKLIEKGADVKNLFKDRRAQAELAAEVKKFDETVRKESRKRRPLMTAPGTVQLPAFIADPAWLGLESEWGIVDVGVLAFVVSLIVGHDSIVNGVDGAEVHGNELRIDANVFPGNHLTYALDRGVVKEALDFLATNALLVIAKSGNVWRIGLGPAYLAAEDPKPLVATRSSR